MPGRVFAHVGQPFEGDDYDFVVIGGGRLGLAAAFYLRSFARGARVLIVEREGIPSESGATDNARGVWTGCDLPERWRAQAAWVRQVWANPAAETGVNRPHDPPFRETGWVSLRAAGQEDRSAPDECTGLPADVWLQQLSQAARTQLLTLVDFGRVSSVVVDESGGFGSATTLALAYGYGAVKLGADLLLNGEARLTGNGVEIRRLDITRDMRVVVAQTVRVRAAHVIVAAGSEGPELLEADLGVVTPHGRAYVQFPRLELPPAPGLPVIEQMGFMVRPGEGALRVLPPVRGADPAGYAACGGRLAGVPVGVRREVLEDLLAVLEDWPVFASEHLNLGKTVSDVRGYWEARPKGGWPCWESVTPGVTLLLGGKEADRVGLAIALDLAATLTNHTARPWNG